jgi:hypothetical protein
MANIFDIITGERRRTTFSYSILSDAQDRNVEQEILKLDAALNIGHDTQTTPTEHPLEDGASISDHIIRKPAILSIEGIVTDDPISIVASALGAVSGIPGSLIGGVAGSVVSGAISALGSALLEGDGRRSVNAYETLLNLQKEGIPLTVVTGLKTYTNMVLFGLNVPQSSRNSNALQFSAKLKKIEIAVSETVIVPKEAISNTARNSGSAKEKRGNTPTTTTDEAVEGKARSSLLFKILT